MTIDKFKEIPLRAKKQMARDVAEIVLCLHRGHPEKAKPLIQDLKARCVHLHEQIQQDVLIFVEQVQFQFAYDQWHNVTYEVEQAADNLLEDLGLLNPHLRAS